MGGAWSCGSSSGDGFDDAGLQVAPSLLARVDERSKIRTIPK